MLGLAERIDLRDAEVEDLHERRACGTAGHEEVRELHIAMDDAEAVRFRERLARLHQVVGRLADRDRTALLRERGEVAPVEVLHDDVRLVVLERADIEDLCDVLVLEADDGLRLAEEATRRLLLLGGATATTKKLHRDELVELEVPRRDDVAHAAATKHAFDAVLACEDIARTHGRHR